MRDKVLIKSSRVRFHTCTVGWKGTEIGGSPLFMRWMGDGLQLHRKSGGKNIVDFRAHIVVHDGMPSSVRVRNCGHLLECGWN